LKALYIRFRKGVKTMKKTSNYDPVQLAKNIEDEMINWRRELHQFPELGLELPQTSQYVQSRLTEMGIPFKTLVDGNAIVGLIEGSGEGPVLAIRADMDGLPIAENTGLEFASTNGNMHACGHDAHTAMLLGAAKILNEIKEDLNGAVKLIFQPAEEFPGGAKPMLDEGAFENPSVDHVIGLHAGYLDATLPVGTIGTRKNELMASMDRFQINIKGNGSHGAYPEDSRDPIAAAGQIITAIQTIKGRNIKATEPVVVSITRVEGGYNQNIIPDNVELEGTVRTFDNELREFVHNKLEQIATGVGTALGVEAEVIYDYKYPPVLNDPAFTENVINSFNEIFPEGTMVESEEPLMGGEDFAFYLEQVPGTFFFLNNPGKIDGKFHGHHHEKFDVDESKFFMGTAGFVRVALDLLSE